MAISIYWNLYYLTFTNVISFYAQKVSIWLIMLMIVPFTILVDLLMKLLINCKNDSRIIIDWYVSNYLKPNSDKWHLLLSYAGNDVRILLTIKKYLIDLMKKYLEVILIISLILKHTLISYVKKQAKNFMI